LADGEAVIISYFPVLALWFRGIKWMRQFPSEFTGGRAYLITILTLFLFCCRYFKKSKDPQRKGSKVARAEKQNFFLILHLQLLGFNYKLKNLYSLIHPVHPIHPLHPICDRQSDSPKLSTETRKTDLVRFLIVDKLSGTGNKLKVESIELKEDAHSTVQS